MFTYQENTFWSQATECSREAFWEAVRKSATKWRIDSRREIIEAVEKHDGAVVSKWLENSEYRKFLMKKEQAKRAKEREAFMQKSDEERLLAFASDLKAGLPVFIVSCREFDATDTAKGGQFRHRRLKDCHLNGLVMLDIDHVDDPMEIWHKLKQNEALMARTMLVHITSSRKGLRIIFTADAEKGNLADNQIDFAQALGYVADRSCIDATRTSFAPKEEDILFINDMLFTYYDEEFDRKYTADYRNGETQAINYSFNENETAQAPTKRASGTTKREQARYENHDKVQGDKVQGTKNIT